MTTKSKSGRPTLFDRSMIEKAKEYIWYFQLSEEDQEARRGSRTNPIEVIPSAGGLARYLDVHRSTLYEWAKTNKEFSDTLDALQDIQEVLLLNNGLTGKFTAPIAKLALANHGYSDKQEIDNKSSDGSMTPTRSAQDLTDDELAAIATANIGKRGS